GGDGVARDARTHRSPPITECPMKMLRFAAVLWTAGCFTACSSQSGTTGPTPTPTVVTTPASSGHLSAPRDASRGVTFDSRWRVFADAWARITHATTAQEFEDAVNAHPLAGPVRHNVAGAFHRFQSGYPDCHVDQTIANNVSTVAVYVDGSDHT